MGVTSLWILGLGASCLLGLVIGFAARPYIIPIEGSNYLSETWKLCLINLGTQIPMCFFDIRSAIANLTLFTVLRRLVSMSLSHLSLMFRTCLFESQISRIKYGSMLDVHEDRGCRIRKRQMVADQLKDLISFDGGPESPNLSKGSMMDGDENQDRSDALSEHNGKIDNMIGANIAGFAAQAEKTNPFEGSLPSSSGLLKRR